MTVDLFFDDDTVLDAVGTSSVDTSSPGTCRAVTSFHVLGERELNDWMVKDQVVLAVSQRPRRSASYGMVAPPRAEPTPRPLADPALIACALQSDAGLPRRRKRAPSLKLKAATAGKRPERRAPTLAPALAPATSYRLQRPVGWTMSESAALENRTDLNQWLLALSSLVFACVLLWVALVG